MPGEAHIQFRFIVGNNNRALEYEDAPSQGYDHPTPLDSGWLAEGTRSWDIVWGGFYGGHITHVEIQVRRTGEQQPLCTKQIARNIWIIGGPIYQSNGTPTLASYLDTLANLPSNNKIMCKAIAKTETDTTHHWWGTGVQRAFHKRYPLREQLAAGGYGGGYGMMQLTSPDLLNLNSIWNWKGNVSTGLARIAQAIQTATNRLSAHTPYTNVQLRLEAYAAYNGGSFHVWNGTAWIEDPSWVCGGACVPRKGRKVVNGQPTGDCTPIAQCYAEVAYANEY